VNSVVPGSNAYITTFGGSIHDSFGSNVIDGPLTILLASECVFTGAATTRSSFLSLAQNPPAGFLLTLTIQGIGTGTANEVRAYEIETQIDSN